MKYLSCILDLPDYLHRDGIRFATSSLFSVTGLTPYGCMSNCESKNECIGFLYEFMSTPRCTLKNYMEAILANATRNMQYYIRTSK